jgi:hypothetical protein
MTGTRYKAHWRCSVSQRINVLVSVSGMGVSLGFG